MAKAAGAGSEEEEEIFIRKINQSRCKNASDKDYIDLQMETRKLPPNEERCCYTSGNRYRYRCKNFRIRSHGGAADDDTVPKSKHCEKHYNYFVEYKEKKKTSKDGEGAGSGPDLEKTRKASGGEEEGRCSRKFGKGRCKNDSADNEMHYCEKHYKDYKDLELERKKLPPDEQRCIRRNHIPEGKSGWWRCKNFRMISHGYCEKHYIYYDNKHRKHRKNETGGIQPDTSGSAKIGMKRDNVETTRRDFLTENPFLITSSKLNRKKKDEMPPDEQRCCQTDGNTWRCKNFRMDHGAAAADYTVPKTNRCEKHYRKYAKYSKKRNRKKTSGDGEGAGSGPTEDTAGSNRWRKEKVTEEEDKHKENVHHKITQTIEKQSDKHNMCKPNTETSCGGRKDSHVYEFKIKDNVHHESESELPKYSDVSIPSGSVHLLIGSENIEEGEGWGSLEETPSQHGSSSQAHDLEMSNKTFGSLVSDLDDSGDSLAQPEDSTGFVDSNNSFGDPMDTLVMKNSNRNKDEMDWKSFLGFPFSYTFGLD